MLSDEHEAVYDSLLNPELANDKYLFTDIFPYDQSYRWSFMDFGARVKPGGAIK